MPQPVPRQLHSAESLQMMLQLGLLQVRSHFALSWQRTEAPAAPSRTHRDDDSQVAVRRAPAARVHVAELLHVSVTPSPEVPLQVAELSHVAVTPPPSVRVQVALALQIC